jgi:hypothetical protein
MPITIPNYSRKTDRHQFGTLIGIPRNPQSFRQFGGRKIQPVIPGLTQLARHVAKILLLFE